MTATSHLFFSLLTCLLFALSAQADDGIVRILGVGNSFTRNAQRHLPQLVSADPEVGAEVGIAYIGGCSLEQHAKLLKKHEADPESGRKYRYSINHKEVLKNASLKEILRDRDWDIVTIQQVSTGSYTMETFYPYTGELIAYIRKHSPESEIVIHETWSHSVDSYRNREWKLDPDDMYAKLHANYAQIAEEFDLRILPVGTAFQNARATPMWSYTPTTLDVNSLTYPEDKNSLPDESKSLTRIFFWRKNDDGTWNVRNDGFHANASGEYLGSLVWYAALFGKDPRQNLYKPHHLSDEQAASLREVAYQTVVEEAK